MNETYPHLTRIADRFELEAEVHSGVVAHVYRARDAATGQRVALKLPAGNDARAAARLSGEGAILAELDHQSIVRRVSHESSVERGAYLATAWIEGETLSQRIERKRPTIAESVEILRSAAEGLAHAHQRQIVHRDVKPANLMLGAGSRRAVVLDFGIARRERGRGLIVHSSFAGGTWAYMSPEQAMGAAELGARTDVFSLGCVLFECLAGTQAFPSARSLAITAKIWQEPPRVQDHCSGVPRKLLDLVQAMMHKDPFARPGDCGVVVRELKALGPLPDRVAEQFVP